MIPPLSSIKGTACLTHRKVPFRLISKTRSQVRFLELVHAHVRAEQNGGAVDQHIQPAELLPHQPHQVLHRGSRGDIGGHETGLAARRPNRRRRLFRLLVDIGNDYPGALACVLNRRGFSQSHGSSGDERDFIFQEHIIPPVGSHLTMGA